VADEAYTSICLETLTKFAKNICRLGGPGSLGGISTGYGLDGPGIESRIRTCPDRHWGPPSLLYSGYRVVPGGKERPGRDANPSPLLVPWSKKSRDIPLFPLWAVRPVQSLSACTRVQFTFTFTHADVCILPTLLITQNCTGLSIAYLSSQN